MNDTGPDAGEHEWSITSFPSRSTGLVTKHAAMKPNPSETRSSGILISQRENYAASFGEVLRSSALFWAKNDARVRTTISFSNYWKFKNSTDVAVLVNLRRMGGQLLGRTRVAFDNSAVCNYTPPENFEGSVEVEAFSTRNLRIPYAAIMAVYECPESITMVHSYTRAYSQHEIEDRRTICVGEESCWTVRDTDSVISFCVLHNGSGRIAAQTARLGVRNAIGEEKVVHFELPALAPFQTVLIEPRAYFPELVAWLGGRPGNGRISFKLEGGFTRLLCGVRSADWQQLQVTHSNFDYSIHDTDKIEAGIVKAYMYTPNVANGRVKQEIVVYPDTNRGEYTMTGEGFTTRFRTGEIVRKQFEDNTGRRVEFVRADGVLPTRIVTALRLNQGGATIPAECSLGVLHHERPPKHFSWMLVSRKFGSTVCWVDFREVYGGCPPEAKVVFNLYSTTRNEPLSRKLDYSDLPGAGSIALDEIFDGKMDLADAYGYLTVWCSYGGLLFFSTLEKRGSISIEHSF